MCIRTSLRHLDAAIAGITESGERRFCTCRHILIGAAGTFYDHRITYYTSQTIVHGVVIMSISNVFSQQRNHCCSIVDTQFCRVTSAEVNTLTMPLNSDIIKSRQDRHGMLK